LTIGDFIENAPRRTCSENLRLIRGVIVVECNGRALKPHPFRQVHETNVPHESHREGANAPHGAACSSAKLAV